MKTKLLYLALFGLLVQIPLFAQDRTTVNATSNEISDNLDLRAVASIFGEARDLQDFEQRLNDPKNQISNLDLNFDRQVDYLRVIEAVEKNTHLIILQAVLEKDVFQDVATIEVEKDRNNQVQIQVVGDVFMYGPNYIYEPVYVTRPYIYNVFWVSSYNPYYSPYYYGYYPTYYYAWTPYPIYRYRRNVHIHINHHNHYAYSNHRRSTNAVAMYETRRRNGYEANYDSYSTRRNNYSSTRYDNNRSNASTRNTGATSTRNTAVRNTTRATSTRSNNSSTRADLAQQSTSPSVNYSGNTTRSSTSTPTRNANSSSTRSTSAPVRESSSSVRSGNTTRSNTPTTRSNSSSSSRSTAPTTRSSSATRG